MTLALACKFLYNTRYIASALHFQFSCAEPQFFCYIQDLRWIILIKYNIMPSQSDTEKDGSMDRGECQHAFFCYNCLFIPTSMGQPHHEKAANGLLCFSCGEFQQCGTWVSSYISPFFGICC